MSDTAAQPSAAELAQESADQYRLGALIAHYRSSYAVAVAVILGSNFAVLLGIMQGLSHFRGRRRALDQFDMYAFAALAVVAIICDLAALFRFRKRISHAFVFDEGLVTVDQSEAEACRWDEIDEVRYSSDDEHGVRHRTYTLELADGREIELADLTNFRQLAGTVREKTRDRLLAVAMAKYEAGEAIYFEPAIQVDRTGVTVEATVVPWDDVKDVIPPGKDGTIYVQRHRGWFKVKLGDIRSVPNYFVLVALLRTVLGQELPPESARRYPSFVRFALGCFLLVIVIVGLLMAAVNFFFWK